MGQLLSVIFLQIFTLLITSCDINFLSKNGHAKKEIYLIKQWHLSAQVNTQDIKASKRLEQFVNQRDIYIRVAQMIEEQKVALILSEGCEGTIDQDFALKHNGWDYQSLSQKKESESFADILALIALKIAVQYPQVKVECGDNEQLIERHSLSLSELRGHIGFYTRLLEYSNDDIKFYRYARKLDPTLATQDKLKVIQHSKQLARKSLDTFLELIEKRNQAFIKKVEDSTEKKQAIIIGGMHVNELAQQLASNGHEVTVITPSGYYQEEETLVRRLKNFL